MEGAKSRGMSHIFNAALRNNLDARLQAFERLPTSQSKLKRAAVAITIVPTQTTAGETTAGFLLTRRAPKLNAHAGQWALPGGRLDAGETVIEAALRELEEEISLTPSRSEERRVGKECVRTGRSRGAPKH